MFNQTRVRDIMSKELVVVPPDCTLQEAAQRMDAVNCGVLPVGTRDKLQGIITDRDIVLRAVAEGKDITKEIVRDYMTREVHGVREDDTPDRAAGIMRERNISRVIVEDEDGRPCGILTFGRIIRNQGSMQEITTAIECAVGRKAA